MFCLICRKKKEESELLLRFFSGISLSHFTKDISIRTRPFGTSPNVFEQVSKKAPSHQATVGFSVRLPVIMLNTGPR